MVDEKLSPARRLMIAAVAMAMASAGFAAGRILLRPNRSVDQPVEFNHKLHVEEVELECSTCHEYFASGEHSGLPTLETCMQCHEEALTETSEEQKLLRLADEGGRAEFRKLFRMPDHVFYSHRQHVTAAGLECATCHGDIEGTTAPPRTPLVRITMDTCVNCHAERAVNTDCTHCHR